MLKALALRGFRNYELKDLEFSDGVNVIFGDNAKGKTNILEAIYLLGVGDSFRAKRTEEMVKFGNELGRVKGVVDDPTEGNMTLEVLVNGGLVMGKKVNKRKYLIDGVSKMKKDAVGWLPLVLFRPEDVDLISGSPDVRRKFLDRVLVQIDGNYVNALSNYEQALRRRNKVLDSIREGTSTRHALAFWNGLMVKYGTIVQVKRKELVAFINELFAKSELFNKLKIDLEDSVVSESRLEQYLDAEIALGYSLVGPHKDELVIRDGDRRLSVYGSRGEQRMAVLAMKMGEIYYLEEQTRKRVLLLLDDIFSELDETHKQEVLRVTLGRQVLVTTADEDDLKMFAGASVFSL